MPLAIDGFKILRKISKNSELFPDIRSDAAKAAQSFVEKQLKAKSTDLNAIQEICARLGDENFGLVVESMKDATIKTLVTKLDRHHPNLKTSDAGWRRRHAMALATRHTAPTPKPEPSKKPRKPAARKAKAAEPMRLSTEVFDALKRRG